MTNDTAERLRTYLVSPVETHPSELQTLLDEALAAERHRAYAEGMDDGRLVEQAACREKVAAERRATVEQIREAFTEFWSDEAVKQDYAFHPSLLFRILDEKAAP